MRENPLGVELGPKAETAPSASPRETGQHQEVLLLKDQSVEERKQVEDRPVVEEKEQVKPRTKGIRDPDSPEESLVTRMTHKKIQITWIYRSGRKVQQGKGGRRRNNPDEEANGSCDNVCLCQPGPVQGQQNPSR